MRFSQISENSIDHQKAEVLIVDDQSFNIFALQSQITSKGIICDSAISGKIAVEMVRERL